MSNVEVEAGASHEVPVEDGAYLFWEDLKISVEIKKLCRPASRKNIIKGVSGYVKPGQILAVLGASGAGKSTLFNVLAKKGGTGADYRTTGTAELNGKPYTSKHLQRTSGFVWQHSIFHTHLTCRETLLIAARLKLPKELTEEQRQDRVEDVIQGFDLDKCADTRVGGAGVKGISGGERKRLAIAIEVLDQPRIMFLDEPTTGLDSASSLALVKSMRRMADFGTSIVCVIHQPRSLLIPFFDNFLVLSDGRSVYFGSFEHMETFFGSQGFDFPPNTNALDFILDLINTAPDAAADPEAERRAEEAMNKMMGTRVRAESAVTAVAPTATKSRNEIAEDLATAYQESGLWKISKQEFPDSAGIKKLGKKPPRAACWSRFLTLLKREQFQKLRNPASVLSQLLTAAVIGLLLGSIYWQIPPEDQLKTATALAFASLVPLFLSFHVILLFPTERTIYIRDSAQGLYHSLEYYFALNVSELPGMIVSASIVSTIVYFMCGFRMEANAYGYYLVLTVLGSLCSSALFIFCGAVSPDTAIANSAVSIIFMFCFLLNSFFSTDPPGIYAWIVDINFLSFVIGGVLVNQFHNTTFNCTVGVDDCLFASGDELLAKYSLSAGEAIGISVAVLAGTLVAIHILAFIAVTFCYTGKLRQCCKRNKQEDDMQDELDSSADDGHQYVVDGSAPPGRSSSGVSLKTPIRSSSKAGGAGFVPLVDDQEDDHELNENDLVSIEVN